MTTNETYENRWWIALTVMLVAVIEVLDSTIVNVSLPNMMGSLGANIDQITWVLTSYIVAAAVCMPLTGYLVKRFGQRKLLLINIVGFLIASMLCGTAMSLLEIVVFRIFQGIFGASLVPLSQFILRDTFPKKEQGTAMAMWGIGIMSAPILGPALGGVITEYFSWRWIFYINLPVCALAYVMTLKFIHRTETERGDVDWIGLGLMVVAIACFQMFLDRGNNINWFDAASTRWLTVGYLVSTPLLIWRCLNVPNPIINLHVFKDRNFLLSTLLLSGFILFLFGQLTLSPLFLQNLVNYPSLTAGLAMGPRGLASMVGMALAGRWLKKTDARNLIFLGLLLAAYGTYLFAHFNTDISFYNYFYASLFQGFGMGLFFVPLSTIALATLPNTELAGAAGLWGLSRNFGQSLGISIMATILSRTTQTNWNTLGSHISSFNTNLTLWTQNAHQTLGPVAYQLLAQQLEAQAQMIAFNNIAWISAVGMFALLPFVCLMKAPPAGAHLEDQGLH